MPLDEWAVSLPVHAVDASAEYVMILRRPENMFDGVVYM